MKALRQICFRAFFIPAYTENPSWYLKSLEKLKLFRLCGCVSRRKSASARFLRMDKGFAGMVRDVLNMDMGTMTVCCRRADLFIAYRMENWDFASKVSPILVGMTGRIPERSRLLGAQEKKCKEDHKGRWCGRIPSGIYGRKEACLWTFLMLKIL